MHTDTFLVGHSVIMRPVRESDAEYFVKWRNDPEVRRYMLNRVPQCELAEKSRITQMSQNTRCPTSMLMVIETQCDARPIGTIGLHNVNWIDRNATTGSMIGETAEQGKGYATDAKMHLLRYAFDVLGMHKIISHSHAENTRSIAYSLRCGYVREALLREEFFHEGEWKDMAVLSCFAKSWKATWEFYVQNGYRFPSES